MADELNLDTLEAMRNALLCSPNYADSVAAEFYGNIAYPNLVAEVRRLREERDGVYAKVEEMTANLRKELTVAWGDIRELQARLADTPEEQQELAESHWLAGMSGTWYDQLLKEKAENERMQGQFSRALDILYECAADGCLYDEETGGWDDLGVESLGSALRFLAEQGRLELVDKPGYSGVIARPPASKEAGQEG